MYVYGVDDLSRFQRDDNLFWKVDEYFFHFDAIIAKLLMDNSNKCGDMATMIFLCNGDIEKDWFIKSSIENDGLKNGLNYLCFFPSYWWFVRGVNPFVFFPSYWNYF